MRYRRSGLRYFYRDSGPFARNAADLGLFAHQTGAFALLSSPNPALSALPTVRSDDYRSGNAGVRGVGHHDAAARVSPRPADRRHFGRLRRPFPVSASMLGARATLGKPFSGDDLLNVVRTVLGG